MVIPVRHEKLTPMKKTKFKIAEYLATGSSHSPKISGRCRQPAGTAAIVQKEPLAFEFRLFVKRTAKQAARLAITMRVCSFHSIRELNSASVMLDLTLHRQ